jgi:N-acetylmuramoyl-L-alanine amidase
MIDPSGDAKYTGRIIEDFFERAITFSLAQAIETTLHTMLNCTVILTRAPGEIVAPLQNANFSNRLPVDLFINLNCYQAPHEKLSLYVYYLSYGEFITSPPSQPTLIPFEKAHLQSIDRTKTCAQHIAQIIRNTYAHSISMHGPFGIPCIALKGIIAPALNIELHCATKEDWKACVEPLSVAITEALTV